jgi:cell division septation protein DedD
VTGRRVVVALVATVGMLTGCGAAPVTVSAATQVPSLGTSLNAVDVALAHLRYGAARGTLLTLISETEQAERSGSISAASAARIIDAARKVLALLPHAGAGSRPHSTPVPQQITSVSPSPSTPHAPVATPTPSSPVQPPPPTPTPTPTQTPTPTATPTQTPSASPAGLVSPSP